MPPKISEVLDGVYDRDIGWRPASGSIKPVHLANGLLRELQGGFYDLEALNRFVVWWRRGKVADDSRSLETLLDDEWIGPRIAGLRGRRQEFERLRRYALGLLNADRALFRASCRFRGFVTYDRPGRAGQSPPKARRTMPISGVAEWKPKAIRVSKRMRVLTDSTRALLKPNRRVVTMVAR